jgi:hypothetical protein
VYVDEERKDSRSYTAITAVYRHSVISSRVGCVVKSLDIAFPLLFIHAVDAPVICNHAVDLALDVSGLGPDSCGACVVLDLAAELFQKEVGALVPDVEVGVEFVGRVNAVYRFLDFPETVVVLALLHIRELDLAHLLLCGNVMANTAKLALDSNSFRVVRGRVNGVPRRSALRVRIVVVVRIVSGAEIVPSRDGIDEPSPVKAADHLCKFEFRVVCLRLLTPAFVEDDLKTNH